jgi:hypothetical protein
MSGTMSHAPDQVIRQLLVDLGLASDGTLVWPVFAGQEPDVPDDCITVYDTGITREGRFQIGGEEQTAYNLQIKIRSATQQEGYVKANSIQTTLASSVHNTVTTVTDDEGVGTATQSYMIYAISLRSFFRVPVPYSDRKIWTCNIQATITQSP